FQNNDLPGVMLGSAAQRLTHLYAVKPCDRCVVLAGNSDAYGVALDLHRAGVAVAAIADLRPGGETGELGKQVAAAGIKVHAGWTVHEAIPGSGKASITGAVLHSIDGQSELRLACDGVIVSVGWAPS